MLTATRAWAPGVLALPLVVGCADIASPESSSGGQYDASALDASALDDSPPLDAPLLDAATTDAGTQGQAADDAGIDAVGSADVATTVAGGILLLKEARRILGAARSSTYSHTTYVDEATGTFDFDCSGFVDYAMSRVVPAAFADLQLATVKRPVAASYETFMASLGAGTTRWQRLSRVADLAPGDIVAWLEPPVLMSSNTGHVMVVDGTPQAGPTAGEWVVQVIDSTESPHGRSDTRAPSGEGIGAGPIVLMADATDAPTGYHWSTLSSSTPYMTQVALGRLP
jgi:hypothetical protein